MRLVEYKDHLNHVEPNFFDRVLAHWIRPEGLIGHACKSVCEFILCAQEDYREDSVKFADRIIMCGSYRTWLYFGKFEIHIYCDTGGALFVTIFGPPEAKSWEDYA